MTMITSKSVAQLSMLLLTFCCAIAQAEPLSRQVDFNIVPQRLAAAIVQFSEQAHVQVISSGIDVTDQTTPGVIGRYTVADALNALLRGTGLRYKAMNENTVSLQAIKPSTRTTQMPEAPQSSVALAQADSTQNPRADTTSSLTSVPSDSEKSRLGEIVVTAQKRTERLQDVPIAITVLDPQTLAENGQNRLIDYFSSVPGLNVAASPSGGGTQYLTLRGLSAGVYQNPTVATVIDDIPIASSMYWNQGNLTAPDLDPSDLARIEVLKGPQGTLYGADSLGGLIKYVTVDPSTSAFTGRVEVSGVDVPEGGLGYITRGAVNVPVSDQLAVRASAFYRQDPGYIDDLTTGQKNFNSPETYGGHVAVLWRPEDNLSLKLGALIQETHGNTSQVNSDGSLQFPQGAFKFTGLPGSSDYYTQTQLYSAVVNAKIAGIDVTSLTGYAINKLLNWFDYSNPIAGVGGVGAVADQLSMAHGMSGFTAATSKDYYDTHKVSEELRASSSIGHWLDWRIGGFYTHEDNAEAYTNVYAAKPTGALGISLLESVETPVTFRESAVFGDVTVHITDRFDVALGGREAWSRQLIEGVNIGPAVPIFVGGTSPSSMPAEQGVGNAFTYQVAPKFKITPDLMIYARVASGYRIGGGNPDAALLVAAGLPTSYAPDRTTNYELGIKGTLLDHRLSFDASAYHIRWSNFQIDVTTIYTDSAGSQQSLGYVANAGNAKSEGVEFSLEGRPTAGLTITAQGSFDNAVLTDNLPAASGAYGPKGDRLPYSMRLSGGLAANQEIRLPSNWVGFFGASVNYIGNRLYEFPYASSPGSPPPARIEFPGYAQINLRAGARHDSWLINLYVNNVADRDAVLGVESVLALGATGGYYASVLQPRTVGINLAKTF
jgi:iron complex outermembrane receptor protein